MVRQGAGGGRLWQSAALEQALVVERAAVPARDYDPGLRCTCSQGS